MRAALQQLSSLKDNEIAATRAGWENKVDDLMKQVIIEFRPNKKMPVLRVTRPYLYLLVKPRIISGFLEKNFFMLFERQSAFQNA